jgi:predicted Abi (CAAX) family protease
MNTFIATLLAGLRKLPDTRAAIEALVLFLMVIASGGAFVWGAGIPLNTNAFEANTLMLWVSTFLFPTLSEELVFRGWLRKGMSLPALAALLAFVAWHPLQYLVGLPFASSLYMEPRFLAVVAVLGLACSITRVRSGSIWPGVILHWGAVVILKSLFSY